MCYTLLPPHCAAEPRTSQHDIAWFSHPFIASKVEVPRFPVQSLNGESGCKPLCNPWEGEPPTLLILGFDPSSCPSQEIAERVCN